MKNSSILKLPTPTSITYMWNWGSMLGINLVMQIVTGILLASHYNSSIDEAFNSMAHIMRDVGQGYFLRFMHMNGASIFFILVFIHISRSLNQSSFKLTYTWLSGVAILLMLMGTAFMGYVLPWGQMSFWGATVITNLLSAIPYIGTSMVQWLWGGFSIGMSTLSRFFALHFLMPFVLTALILIHLISLHTTGSSKPSGTGPDSDKTPFQPFFMVKDLVTIILLVSVSISISSLFPLSMGDPENFNSANPLNTPPHIQPEWYFLFAYAILRSIPNKLGGVIALLMSILSLSLMSISNPSKTTKKFVPNSKIYFWTLSSIFIVLTFIGSAPVEEPFEQMGIVMSGLYFLTMGLTSYFLLIVLKTMKKFNFSKFIK